MSAAADAAEGAERSPVNPQAFIDDFRAEAAEHLRTLDAQALVLERAPTDLRPVRAMFLAAHSIKGGAAMLELADVRNLAHALEDVLASLRDGKQELEAAGADLLFRAIDQLRVLLDRVATDGTGEDAQTLELVAALRRQAAGDGGVTPPAAPRAELPEVAAASTGPRVLLVEDSATVRLVETLLLQDAGFVVDGVGNGAVALKMTRSVGYALVIAGVESSGLTGLELAAALRDAGAGKRPAVLLTTLDERTLSHDGSDAVYAPKGTFADATMVTMAREAAGRGGL